MTKFEKNEGVVNSVVDVVGNIIKDFKRFPKKRKIIVSATVILTLFNEEAIKYALNIFKLNLSLPTYYNFVFWIVVLFLIFWAIGLKVKESDATIILSYNSPIKGPLSFEEHDEEIFKKLQRTTEVSTYIDALYRREFKIGIITGVSGCGKSSLLNAGLTPAIDSAKYVAVVVTFTNASLEQLIINEIKNKIPNLNTNGSISLDEFVKLATDQISPKILILVFDQFEQLFTQYAFPERKLFFEKLKNIYDQNSNAKILISIRSDFLDNLYELQEEIKYTLNATKNYFRLQNFTAEQAVVIFKVITQLEYIQNTDNAFLLSFAKNELASNKDGLVSPVDIQIALLVIKRNQINNNLTAGIVGKLGGFQGMLKKYLDDELNVPNAFNRDNDILNTLVSLIDTNEYVRAGQLTLQEIEEKNLVVHNEALKSILKWLVELRIVHFIERKKKYELAHEKLIEPILEIYSIANTNLQKANILLERRVNEWIGNNRKGSYLLNLREYFFISKYKKLITWGSRETLKKEFLKSTFLRFKRLAAISLSLLFILTSFYLVVHSGWYIKNYKIKSEIFAYIAQKHPSSLSYQELNGLAYVDPKLTDSLSIDLFKTYYSSSKYELLGNIIYNLPEKSKEGEIIFDEAIKRINSETASRDKTYSICYLAVSFASHDPYKALKIVDNISDSDAFPLFGLNPDSLNKYNTIAQLASKIAKHNFYYATAVANKLPTFYKDLSYSLFIEDIANKNRSQALKLAKSISSDDYINRYKSFIIIAENMAEKNSQKNPLWDTVKNLVESIPEWPSYLIANKHDHYIPKYILYCRIAQNLSDNDPMKKSLWKEAIDDASKKSDKNASPFYDFDVGYPSEEITKLLYIYTKIGSDSLLITRPIQILIKNRADSLQFLCLSAYINAERNPTKAKQLFDKTKSGFKLLDTANFDPFILYSSLNYVPNNENSPIKAEILDYLVDYINKNPRLQRSDVLLTSIVDQFEKMKLFRKAYLAIENMSDYEKIIELEKLYSIWTKSK